MMCMLKDKKKYGIADLNGSIIVSIQTLMQLLHWHQDTADMRFICKSEYIC